MRVEDQGPADIIAIGTALTDHRQGAVRAAICLQTLYHKAMAAVQPLPGKHWLGLMMMTGALIWGAIYLAKHREEPPDPAADW